MEQSEIADTLEQNDQASAKVRHAPRVWWWRCGRAPQQLDRLTEIGQVVPLEIASVQRDCLPTQLRMRHQAKLAVNDSGPAPGLPWHERTPPASARTLREGHPYADHVCANPVPQRSPADSSTASGAHQVPTDFALARQALHWLRHTTLTWVERHFTYGIARAYAGHTDNTGPAATT
jgi:hypothetical protein